MLCKSFEDQPAHPVVAESPGRESNPRGYRIATGGHDRIDPAADLALCARLVEVCRSGSNNVSELDSLGCTSLGHHVGRLLLAVFLATVGNGGQVEQVERVVRAIVNVP